MRNIDEYTTEYAIPSFEDYQVKYRRKLILEQIERYKPTNILEIGCGYEPLFQYTKGIRYTVVEPSKEFYGAAKKIAKETRDVLCINGTIEEVVEELEPQYDMIICSSLLHEVENPRGLLHAIRRICNNETVVHVNVPNANSMHRLIAFECGMISDIHNLSERNKTLQQNSTFDIESLADEIKKNNMVVIEQGSYFVKPFTHAQMYQMLENGIIQEEILDGLYHMSK
ncbi:MAG: class I SAM-dependent methyltransferase, partial [Lachnospiraceae bacterium]|nr:class I SAM-dependent methyltransferase [Lachnospiraceae bacterium]